MITADSLADMTYARWLALPEHERARLRDMSAITGHPFAPFKGDRIEWREDYGDGPQTRRAWIGRSTGWRPVLLTLHNTRSRGGDPAPDPKFIVPGSVRLIRTQHERKSR